MPKIGDHLKSSRGLYTHHGIYVGDERVIHYSGLSAGIQSGPIEEVSFDEFCSGNEYELVKHGKRKYNREKCVGRAISRLGEDSYSVTGNNCEHFVNWCIDGNHRSRQVDAGTAAGSGALSTAAGIASAGSISSSGVMSSLAMVGGGVIVGLGILAGSATASLINNTVLKDDERLDCGERGSRRIGRKATYAGVVAGIAGSITAVSAAGSVSGLSGAGITSGLVAIGGTVGGDMTVGVALTTATPVVAAAAIGYGLYKAVKWFSH